MVARKRSAVVYGAFLWILTAACSGPNRKTPIPPVTSPAGSPPVAVAALSGLLPSPADINTAMHTTGMTIAGQMNQMWDDSAEVADKDCRFADGPAEAPVYAGSGWTAVRGGTNSSPVMTSLIMSDRWSFCFPPLTTRPPSSPSLPNAGRPAPTANTPRVRPVNPRQCGP